MRSDKQRDIVNTVSGDELFRNARPAMHSQTLGKSSWLHKSGSPLTYLHTKQALQTCDPAYNRISTPPNNNYIVCFHHPSCLPMPHLTISASPARQSACMQFVSPNLRYPADVTPGSQGRLIPHSARICEERSSCIPAEAQNKRVVLRWVMSTQVGCHWVSSPE